MSFLATLATRLRLSRLSILAVNPQRITEPSFKAANISLQLHPARCTSSVAELEDLEQPVPSTVGLEREEGALPVVGDSTETGDAVVRSGVVNDDVPRTLRERKWNWWSRRTGLVAIKLGMTQMWSKEGFPMAVTVLQVVDNQVVMVRTKQKEGHYSLQIGAHNNPKLKNVPRHMQGQFDKAGVPPKYKLTEFFVTQDGLLPLGTNLYAAHFYPGQFVDVCSKSIGKGFQGVMKRHGMKGQPASHGVTKTHRKMGATGGGQDPGRIWPGKKMPGRMGGKRVTTQNLKVYRINHRFNVLYVHGPVPGHKGTYVRITDAKRRRHKTPPPFPTYIPDPEKPLPEEVYSDDVHLPHEQTLEFEDKRRAKQKRR